MPSKKGKAFKKEPDEQDYKPSASARTTSVKSASDARNAMAQEPNTPPPAVEQPSQAAKKTGKRQTKTPQYAEPDSSPPLTDPVELEQHSQPPDTKPVRIVLPQKRARSGTDTRLEVASNEEHTYDSNVEDAGFKSELNSLFQRFKRRKEAYEQPLEQSRADKETWRTTEATLKKRNTRLEARIAKLENDLAAAAQETTARVEEAVTIWKKQQIDLEQEKRALEYELMAKVDKLSDLEQRFINLVSAENGHRAILRQRDEELQKLQDRCDSAVSDMMGMREREASNIGVIVKISDDQISGKWKQLAYNIQSLVAQYIAAQEEEGIALLGAHDNGPFSLLSQSRNSVPALRGFYLQAYIWQSVWSDVFSARQPSWGGEIGQHLAKSTQLDVDEDATICEILSTMKSQAARVIDRAFGTNRAVAVALATRLIDKLLSFSTSSKHQNLEKEMIGIYNGAVDLQATLMKSRALFVVSADFSKSPITLRKEPVTEPGLDYSKQSLTESVKDSDMESDVELVDSPPESAPRPAVKAAFMASQEQVADSASGHLAYNPDLMDFCSIQTKKTQSKWKVGIVVSPMLVKVGNADGDDFDRRMVLCKAHVTVE